MNYSNLRSQILDAIKYPPKISAASLQEQLINIVNGLDLGALLLGVATPALTPNTEANGFYFALQSGTYTNFPTINGQTITVDSSEVAVIVRSGNYWNKIHITTYPTIDPTTKHWMIGNEDTGVLAEGTTPHIDQETGNWMIGTYDTGIHAQGAPGKDAYQPFKGTFSSTTELNTAYPNPNAGDTAYVEDVVDNVDVLLVYDVDANGDWHNTGRTANSPTFGSGQLLSSVHIDTTKLANPLDGAIPTAKDSMDIKATVQGFTKTEQKVELDLTTNCIQGKFVSGINGSFTTNNDGIVFFINNLVGYDSIRFLGFERPVAGGIVGLSGYGFSTSQITSETTAITDYTTYDNAATAKAKEYIIKIPSNAIAFACTIYTNVVSAEGFYCYLQKGESAKDGVDNMIIPQLANSVECLLGTNGKVIGDNIRQLFEVGDIKSNAPNAPTYRLNKLRCRSKINGWINLKKGDVIKCANNFSIQVYAFYQKIDGTYASLNVISSDAIVTNDGKYLFVFKNSSENSGIPINQDNIFSFFGFERKLISLDEGLGKVAFTSKTNANSTTVIYKSNLPAFGDNIIGFVSQNNRNIKTITYTLYNSSDAILGTSTNIAPDMPYFLDVSGAVQISITVEKIDNSATYDCDVYALKYDTARYDNYKNKADIYENNTLIWSNVKSINHRGYNTVAPENTLAAFRLSRKMGFGIVETDVRFTSDGVAVLLHDPDINRTARNADGTEISSTVNIADITYDEALTYDFGIYKGSAYQGEKIPTLNQFLLLCKKIGLRAYLELKAGTTAQINGIVEAVWKCGMKGLVTYIGNGGNLGTVKSKDASARLCYVDTLINQTAETDKKSLIESVAALKTNENEVFLDVFPYTSNAQTTIAIGDNDVSQCISQGIGLEVWTLNDASKIDSIITQIPYITGITTDKTVVSKVLRKLNG